MWEIKTHRSREWEGNIRYDLTDNELNSMYYSVDEIEAIRRHARITLDLSESDLEFDQEHFLKYTVHVEKPSHMLVTTGTCPWNAAKNALLDWFGNRL